MSQTNIERFEQLLSSVDRDGIDNLIEFIRKSDFYTAPASTRFHSCHEGGLLEHSLNVYDCLVGKFKDVLWKNRVDVDSDSLIITALLHDITKANYYAQEPKNKKVYSEYGRKSDSVGRYDWETVIGYTTNDKCPLGHSEKSVIILTNYIKLKPNELFGIRWHMGFSEPKENWGYLSEAIKKYPFIIAVYEADLEATYLLEDES